MKGARGLEVSYHDLDVVLLVAIELFKLLGAHKATVHPHEFEAMLDNPGGDRLVVTLPPAD